MTKILPHKPKLSHNGAGGGTTHRGRNPFTHKKHLTIAIILVLIITIGLPLSVYAIQNIFTGFGKIKDIQFEGQNIDQVVYQGTIIWERIYTMQTTTSTNCPTNRVKAIDARDGATYWIRKIPGTKAGGGDLCWMETNLAYAGGGDNTYGDATTPITEGSTDAYATLTEARYYTPLSSNRTTGDTNPSTSTDGGITNPQYGYLYNWCAAMAGQPDACQYTAISQPNQSANPGNGTIYNVCPAGWRLPTGNTSGEFANLNNAINGGRTDTDAGLRANSLYMYSGEWGGSFTNQGGNGIYWSSTSANPTNAGYAYYHLFNSYRSDPLLSYFKRYGFAVRCVTD